MSDILDQPSSIIRDDVIVLDTPQDTINETNNTPVHDVVGGSSGRLVDSHFWEKLMKLSQK